MNVATITMPKEQAEAKLAAYRDQLRRRTDSEYEAAVAGYTALAEGTPLLNLGEAIRGAGFDDKMRPKLAIARADRRQVEFQWHNGRQVGRFLAMSPMATRGKESLNIAVDFGREHGLKDPTRSWGITVEGFALVPMVPADVRPNVDLRKHFVLWEVEQWADKRIGARPDRDPYLLRHVGGDLYAVVAEWDLTELERAIMQGRREQ